MPISSNGPLRVLLVEGHSDTRDSFAKLLQMDGFLVQVAPGFRAAVELASKHRFDLLLCDTALPDGSGAELMRKLLAEQDAIKGIALSQNGKAENVKLCTEAGFSAHLLKPVKVTDLRSAIGQICEDLKEVREEGGEVGPSLEYLMHPDVPR